MVTFRATFSVRCVADSSLPRWTAQQQKATTPSQVFVMNYLWTVIDPQQSESEEIIAYSLLNACDMEHVWKRSPCLNSSDLI